MYIVVGLGNPGTTYAHHRHNVGHMTVAALAARYARPAPVLAGVAAAAMANALIAGIGGTVVSGMITLRALALLVGLAFLVAGAIGFIATCLAAILPARRAARLKVVDALRQGV